jgi:hypothetical protein
MDNETGDASHLPCDSGVLLLADIFFEISPNNMTFFLDELYRLKEIKNKK